MPAKRDPAAGRRGHGRPGTEVPSRSSTAIIAASDAAGAGRRRAPCSARGRCHADDRLRRRAAGRPGGSGGPALRRSGRPAARRGRWARPASTAARVYVTNAVKHFKFEPRGKRRIHQKPTAGEVEALSLVAGEGTGVRAAHAGGGARRHRGAGADRQGLAGDASPRAPAMLEGRPGFITVHPSYLLRLPDEAAKRKAWEAFVADLRQAGHLSAATGHVAQAGLAS